MKALHNELNYNQGCDEEVGRAGFSNLVPNAQSAIRMVIEELPVIHRNLEKLCSRVRRSDAFTLKWDFAIE